VSHNESFARIADTFKLVVATLRDARVPFALGGSLAAWARGAPRPENDLDFMVKPADAEAALHALETAGMRGERPPEEWLFKAWNGDVMIDLIFDPSGLQMSDEVLERTDQISVLAVQTPVLALDDVLTTKLFALGEHSLNYASLLGIARALRELIDWPALRQRTSSSPYAQAFFALTDALDVSSGPESQYDTPRVRVLGTPDFARPPDRARGGSGA
jgi:hypothetical protein